MYKVTNAIDVTRTRLVSIEIIPTDARNASALIEQTFAFKAAMCGSKSMPTIVVLTLSNHGNIVRFISFDLSSSFR